MGTTRAAPAVLVPLRATTPRARFTSAAGPLELAPAGTGGDEERHPGGAVGAQLAQERLAFTRGEEPFLRLVAAREAVGHDSVQIVEVLPSPLGELQRPTERGEFLLDGVAGSPLRHAAIDERVDGVGIDAGEVSLGAEDAQQVARLHLVAVEAALCPSASGP